MTLIRCIKHFARTNAQDSRKVAAKQLLGQVSVAAAGSVRWLEE